MGLKILKKRTNSETADESPPKKQKKQNIKKPESTATKLNGDGNGQALTAAQRKREKSKLRKLAAMARIKEEGGKPKSLWAAKKAKKAAAVAAKGENDKNQTVEEKINAKEKERAEIKKLRKEKRQQDGQYKPDQITLTADEIRLRITEIKGRGQLTKTARRKLAVFVKKLAILEGTAVNKDENKNGGGNAEEKGNLSESVKRRLRREKKGINGDKEEAGDGLSEEENDPGEEKPVNIQLFEKKKKQKAATKKIEQKIHTIKVEETKLGEQKKNKKNKVPQNAIKKNEKTVKREIVKAMPDDDEDEDEDENEDESEDEIADPKNEESSDDDDDDDEEDDEDDDDDDEEEEEEELNSSQQEADEEEGEDDDEEEEEKKIEPVQKAVKKIEGKGKKDKKQGQEAKNQSDQEQNSEKKKRYILFVGNIPFE